MKLTFEDEDFTAIGYAIALTHERDLTGTSERWSLKYPELFRDYERLHSDLFWFASCQDGGNVERWNRLVGVVQTAARRADAEVDDSESDRLMLIADQAAKKLGRIITFNARKCGAVFTLAQLYTDVQQHDAWCMECIFPGIEDMALQAMESETPCN